MSETLVSVTPNLTVPRSRYLEWWRGTRPLPDQQAGFFFDIQVQYGLLSSEQALELRRRHEQLTRQEEALASGKLTCTTCDGTPPPGFACNTCGAGTNRP